MLILKMIGEFILTVTGFFLLLIFGTYWYEEGYWAALKAQGMSFLSLSDFLLPIIGLLLLYFGSFLIVKTFKGNLLHDDMIRLKSTPVVTSIVYILIFVQCCILSFQVCELTRYDEDIREHVPTLSSEGDPEITGLYYGRTIIVPFLSQMILLPAIWAVLLYRAKYTVSGAYLFLISCWLTSFSWFASFRVVGYVITAYD